MLHESRWITAWELWQIWIQKIIIKKTKRIIVIVSCNNARLKKKKKNYKVLDKTWKDKISIHLHPADYFFYSMTPYMNLGWCKWFIIIDITTVKCFVITITWEIKINMFTAWCISFHHAYSHDWKCKQCNNHDNGNENNGNNEQRDRQI